MKEIFFNTNEMDWRDAEGYMDKTKMKVLRDEKNGRTVLLKFPAGFDMEGHTHIHTEQHFVLEGEYEAGGKTYGPGTYQLIPAHTSHGPYTSKEGAIVLVIWDSE